MCSEFSAEVYHLDQKWQNTLRTARNMKLYYMRVYMNCCASRLWKVDEEHLRVSLLLIGLRFQLMYWINIWNIRKCGRRIRSGAICANLDGESGEIMSYASDKFPVSSPGKLVFTTCGCSRSLWYFNYGSGMRNWNFVINIFIVPGCFMDFRTGAGKYSDEML